MENKIIGYCRVSTNRQKISLQKETLRQYAREHGYDVEIYEEIISGHKSPKILWYVINRAKECGCPVIVTHPDRLSRELKYGKEIIDKFDNFIFTGTEKERLSKEEILEKIKEAHIEWVKISRKTKDALSAKRKILIDELWEGTKKEYGDDVMQPYHFIASWKQSLSCRKEIRKMKGDDFCSLMLEIHDIIGYNADNMSKEDCYEIIRYMEDAYR